MNQTINWVRVFCIMGLSIAMVSSAFIVAFYGMFNDDFNYLVSLLVKRGIFESLAGIALLSVFARHTTRDDIIQILKSLKREIIVSAGILLLGVLCGIFLQNIIGGYAASLFGTIEQEAEKIREIPQYLQMLVIFGNNARAATLSGIIASFPILGIFLPIMTMSINGVIIGLAPEVFQMSSSQFLIAILPHGILEIPALILASAVGFTFSFASLKAFIGYFFPHPGRSGRDTFLEEMRPGWRSLKLFAMIIPLLICAAFIEVFITPHIMNFF
ncbi:MAG: stage II sporulation protein M [Theionarchaea archaeon]|nr:stage II sporulation protein M [Theionarchaea archaeon]